jgi:hypothetical protein
LTEEHPDLQSGLAKVRQRRWILWAAILIYVPGLFLAFHMDVAPGTRAKLFVGWVVLLCVAVGLATVVKCPRCGQPFHTNGPTFLPLRRCVHCHLPLNADKNTGHDRPGAPVDKP